jgi:hypothetical protein
MEPMSLEIVMIFFCSPRAMFVTNASAIFIGASELTRKTSSQAA